MQTLDLGGVKIAVRPGTTDEQAAREVIEKHVYDRGALRLDASDVWLDAGGNIGAFAVLAASKGCRVISIEPHPDNVSLLEANTKGLPVLVLAAACAAFDGEAELFVCNGERNKYRHTLFPIKGRQSITIRQVSLQRILPLVNAVKMDIEGSEIELLERCDWSGINKLVFEYHFDRCRSIPRFLTVCERLAAFGFSVDRKRMPDAQTYDFYPAATVVRAVRVKSPNS